jgi:hypothetical protein
MPSVVLRSLLLLAAAAGRLPAAEEYTYRVDECSPEAARVTGCETRDPELARWALEAWQRETNGAIFFRKSESPAHARITIHWANGQMSLYGETEPVRVDGRRGAIIYVLPDTRALGPEIDAATRGDRLLRDGIVYLTCLHESGHALGLRHTAAFADIMYSFGYGGDIVAYFERYRRLLKKREDMPAHSGISEADRIAIRAVVAQFKAAQ